MIPPLIVWVCGNCGHVHRRESTYCDECRGYGMTPAALIPLADDWEPPLADPS